MNWKEECCKRRNAVKRIDKDISLLEKQKKQLGSTRALEIIRVSLEKQLGLPVKIVNSGAIGNPRLVVFVKDATEKQIRYKRMEKAKFSIEVWEDGYRSRLMYRNQDGDFVDMPENTDEIIKIMEEM